MDRRIFIHNVARGGLLAALAATAGILVLRDQVTLRQECTGNFQCRSCTRLKGCELPEAETTRTENGNQGKG